MSQDINLKQLRASRGYAKASITRLYNFINNAQDFDVSGVSILQSKRARIVELFSEYESYNKQILAHDEDDSEDVADIEAKYFQILTVINEAIKVKSSPGAEASTAFKAKLPTIHIETFTGKYNAETSRAYQLGRCGTSDPTVAEFLLFLEKRALALENAELAPQRATRLAIHAAAVETSSSPGCRYCASAESSTTCGCHQGLHWSAAQQAAEPIHA
ncbi:uncharacterized protein [Choristoneura fumiferana]|uniref:uncharacterized protein n=1 Tax=Choristoneura fumiferana TaxID=7141 RepID=UPI003D1538B7